MNYCSLLLALLLPFGGISQTQFVSFQKYTRTSIEKDNCIKLLLTFEVANGYHIQANTPSQDHLIPSALILEQKGETILAEIVFPSPHSMTLGKDVDILVFDGRFEILVQIDEPYAPVKGVLSYQACDDKKCFFPRDLVFEF